MIDRGAGASGRAGSEESTPPLRTYQDLQSFRLPSGFRGRNAFHVQLWWLVQATLFSGSPQPLYAWRRWLLRRFGATVGRGVLVRPTARVTYPWKVTIGDYAWIGDHVELYSLGPIRIGAHAVISQQSYLCTGSHEISSPQFNIYVRPIVVEEEAWVCARVFVHPGVTVARGSVVGSGSVLTTDTHEGVVYSGNPAVRRSLRQKHAGV